MMEGSNEKNRNGILPYAFHTSQREGSTNAFITASQSRVPFSVHIYKYQHTYILTESTFHLKLPLLRSRP